MWNICPHIDRHKCRQIPCLKNGRKIQTSDNFKARLCSYNMFLVYWYLVWAFALVLECSHANILAIILAVLSVVISVFFYTKIYLRLQQHQTQVEHFHQGQPDNENNSLIITQYKKTVYSIAWVQLAMVVCFVPFIISTKIK